MSLLSIMEKCSIISIDSDAFCGCRGLTEVTIPNPVTSVGWNAFDKCFFDQFSQLTIFMKRSEESPYNK